jgi:hypothetical protein
MSLQQAASINQAARAFKRIWKYWLRPAGAPAYPAAVSAAAAQARAAARKTAMRQAIQGYSNFLPNITISLDQNLGAGVLGGLNWSAWTLSINSSFFTNDAITYADFMELCRTAYHETRHGEQVYRAAQALASQAIGLPDTSQATIIQAAATAGVGGVQARIAAFSGNALNNAAVRTQLIVSLLKVPTAVAQHADTNRALFANFAALAKPAWFKRSTVVLEVGEWMRSLAKKSLNEMTMWAESPNAPYAMYRDLPVELDAHSIEDSLANTTTGLIGQNVAVHGAQPRTNTALFGA